MLFNSLAFALFLPTVYLVYWALDRRRQNWLLLVASYVFYGWWDPRFLSLIVFSSLVDYVAARRMERPGARRRRWLLLSLGTNLGLLGVFKYFDFFSQSFASAAASLGWRVEPLLLDVILPVGISFYTFQTLSYTIDVYRGKLTPRDSALDFFTFVAFFPQLVAGPIERASHLLPQFASDRVFSADKAKDGLRQMLWGLFKKVVLADTLAVYVNGVYADPAGHDGGELLVATVFFSFQIYGDFSGYSDIAIGSARLFGFDLMQNFRTPYFARSPAEFWQRWHISLSTWFRDYVYIPLGGSRCGPAKRLRNIFVTFLVSGLWHGANWTFVLWGGLHSLFYLPQLLRKGRPDARPHGLLRAGVGMAGTFALVTLAWVYFRASSVTQANAILCKIARDLQLASVLQAPTLLFGIIAAVVAMEAVHHARSHGLDVARWPLAARWSTYYAVLAAVIFLGRWSNEPFIYFQF